MSTIMRAIAFACAVAGASAFSSKLPEPQPNIVEVATEAGSFTTLLSLVDLIDGLGETLATGGPFTVFAPTDSAFAKLAQEDVDALVANTTELASVLQYHVLSGSVSSDAVVPGTTAKTLNGADVSFSAVDGTLYVNDAEIVTPDVYASNGVIHVIDSVLFPPSPPPCLVEVATEAGVFSTLLTAVQAVPGLLDDLNAIDGGYTLFAPTDEAFSKILPTQEDVAALLADTERLAAILSYHVVPAVVYSESLTPKTVARTVNGQQIGFDLSGPPKVVGATNTVDIATPDVPFCSGVIHIISDVLLPAELGNIVEVASAAGNFSTLLELATQAQLADTLATGGPFTVFAPTDAAFAKLGDAAGPIVNDNEVLTSVLLYHVLDGKVYSEQLVDGQTVTTLNGEKITITLPPQINGASNIVSTDINADNGVIHVIDTVLVPPSVSA